MKHIFRWLLIVGGGIIISFASSYSAVAATLSATSASGSTTLGVGDIITVNINLNTQNSSVQGVDLHYLKYDQTALEVQDENSGTSGVQIAPGSLMPNTVANSVDATTGRINFSQITSGGQTYNGSGILATMRFKGLKTGSTSLSFDFTLNSTTDSNIASNGQDLLTQASGLTLTITTGASTTPTPTPTPTDTPTPPPSGGGSSGGGGSSSGGGGGGGSVPPPSTPTPTNTPLPTPTGVLIYETNPPAGSSAGPVVIRRLTESTPGGMRIPEGGSVSGGVIVFDAQLFDANNNRVKLEVELRRTEELFTGSPTLASVYVNPGETARVERGGLTPGEYKFRARASNIKLEKSEWLEFGNSGAIDFKMFAGGGGGTIATPKPTPLPETGRKPYAFTRTLRRGIKGTDVTQLQNMLKELGYDPGVIDGWYGLKALTAIKSFQQQQGLAADGIFGPKSQARFNLVYAGTSPAKPPTATVPQATIARTLRLGMRGNDVKTLQEKLNNLGFNVGIADGAFGPKTFTQVKAFQVKYVLTVDGVAGPKTLEKLNSLAQ